jgi:hypothetical protein
MTGLAPRLSAAPRRGWRSWRGSMSRQRSRSAASRFGGKRTCDPGARHPDQARTRHSMFPIGSQKPAPGLQRWAYRRQFVSIWPAAPCCSGMPGPGGQSASGAGLMSAVPSRNLGPPYKPERRALIRTVIGSSASRQALSGRASREVPRRWCCRSLAMRRRHPSHSPGFRQHFSTTRGGPALTSPEMRFSRPVYTAGRAGKEPPRRPAGGIQDPMPAGRSGPRNGPAATMQKVSEAHSSHGHHAGNSSAARGYLESPAKPSPA